MNPVIAQFTTWKGFLDSGGRGNPGGGCQASRVEKMGWEATVTRVHRKK